jgi:hypothetical protein
MRYEVCDQKPDRRVENKLISRPPLEEVHRHFNSQHKAINKR